MRNPVRQPSPSPSTITSSHPLGRRLGASLLSAIIAVGPAGVALPAVAQEDDGFSFDIVEEGVKDTDRARLDKARDLLSQEQFDEALAELEAILADKALEKYHPAAEYDLAKTFYRMGAYHLALNRYQKILDVGPKHEFYGQARNWLFFISRKIKDELAALQMVSTYTKAEDIPAEQQGELSYALARFYFLMALNQGAKGVEVEQSEDPPEAEAEPEVAPEPEAATEQKPSDATDDGFNFSSDDLGGGDDDGFGFDFSGTETSKNKGKGKGKPKGKAKAPAKTKAKDEPTTTTAPTEAPASSPEPRTKAAKAGKGGKVKSHKNENPQSAEASLDAALKSVDRVDDKFPLYSQARYLKGLIHFARGEFDPAVKAFRDVVRMTKPGALETEAGANSKLREMAFFSLARIHYQFEQFRYAIFYYDRISRDSEQWLDAMFESSWAHFRLGEYEKSLGNLVTLQSPFFAGEYYPESSILKAITFYQNCRYPEARAFLGEFTQNYGGVLDELNVLVGKAVTSSAESAEGGEKAVDAAGAKSAEELYEALTTLEKKVAEGKDDAASSIALTARLLRLALSDKRVAGFRASIAEVDEEKARLTTLRGAFNGGATATELATALDARRAELVNGAGTLLRDKLEAERGFLTELKGKLVRIQFEIGKMEKETLEATMSNQSQTVNLNDYNFTSATDDERLFWPFEGEYWRDELGTYQYTLTKGCRPPSETTITGE